MMKTFAKSYFFFFWINWQQLEKFYQDSGCISEVSPKSPEEAQAFFFYGFPRIKITISAAWFFCEV